MKEARLNVRIDQDQLEAIDALRKDLSRGAWVRRAVARVVAGEQQKAGATQTVTPNPKGPSR